MDTQDLTDTEVSKAFRARSLRLHPDKCPLPEARAAFDKLNAAHRELRDDISRSHAVRQWAATSDATISKSTMVCLFHFLERILRRFPTALRVIC